MAANTAEHYDALTHDRSFYADLWGNTSRATHAREAWRHRRTRSAVLALLAFGVLLSYLAAGTFVDDGSTTTTAPQSTVAAPTDNGASG